MLQQALEYIVGLKRRDEVVTIDGETFVTQGLQPVPEFLAKPLQVSTLQAIADFIIENRDDLDLSKHLVHVESPTRVTVLGPLTKRQRLREQLLVATPVLPVIELNKFIGREAFQIQLQAAFADTDQRDILLRLVGNMEAGEVRTTTDDGMSQEVVVRKHAGSVGREVAPKTVALCPYRTFTEIAQPEVEFVFRVRDEDGALKCALFEADGGQWRVDAAERVATKLDELLEGTTEETAPAILR